MLSKIKTVSHILYNLPFGYDMKVYYSGCLLNFLLYTGENILKVFNVSFNWSLEIYLLRQVITSLIVRLFLFMCLHVCLHVGLRRQKRASGVGSGVISTHDPPDVGAGSQTRGLSEINKCY